VHADGPGPEWVAELQRAGRHGDHAAVGVLGRLDVGAGADPERRPQVDDETAAGIGGSVSRAYGGAPSRYRTFVLRPAGSCLPPAIGSACMPGGTITRIGQTRIGEQLHRSSTVK
jgi:hypothetical protein